VSVIPVEMPRRLIDIEIDGETVRVPEGATILDACRATGVDTPTMCYADNLTPINACRVCVVEVEGSRVLVPACSRTAEPDMKISTDTDRVRHSRKLVMEFLDSSVDTSLASQDWHRWRDETCPEPPPSGHRPPPHGFEPSVARQTRGSRKRTEAVPNAPHVPRRSASRTGASSPGRRRDSLHLAAWAEPCSAARHDDPVDRPSAPVARLPEPPVHVELVLHPALVAFGGRIVTKR